MTSSRRKVSLSNMKNFVRFSIPVLILVTACSGKEQPAPAQPAATPVAASRAAGGTVPAAPPAPAPAGMLTGKVLETFNSGGYTYLRIETPAGEQWAAVAEAKVAKGDTVAVAAQMTMDNFKSSSLNRTFDKIVFGTIAAPGGPAPAQAAMQAKMPAGHPTPGGEAQASAMGGASQHMKVPDADVKVERAPGGNTVSELWAQKSSLKGKEIVVRGKVVKFLGGIMGTNWMHLQDGTGAGDKGDNDITVTTDEKAAVGDVVTVRGTLTVDKDFGAGYRYAVIVEKAKITK